MSNKGSDNGGNNKTFRQRKKSHQNNKSNQPKTNQPKTEVAQQQVTPDVVKAAQGLSEGVGGLDVQNMPAEFYASIAEVQEEEQRPNIPTGPTSAPPQASVSTNTMRSEHTESIQAPVALDRRSMSAPMGAVDTDFEALIAGVKKVTSVFDTIQLPSMGKFYNGSDGPTDGILHVRPMTGQEEQILATPRFRKRGQVFDMIFKECIQEGIQSDKLLSIDRNFLLIYLRALSYTRLYEVNIKCPACDNNFDYTVNLDDLPVKNCPMDFDETKMTGTIPGCGYEFTYNLMLGSDETLVNNYRENRLKTWGDTGLDDSTLYKTAYLINHITNGTATINNTDGILELLKQMSVGDLCYIRDVVNDDPFGIDTNVPVQCMFCQEEYEIELPIEAGFFHPKMKKDVPG